MPSLFFVIVCIIDCCVKMKELIEYCKVENIDNKYHQWYQKLIERAVEEPRSHLNYYEDHHILPRSLGGSDSPENMVSLSAREHYVAHHLLWRMLKGNAKVKMAHAFKMMADTRGHKVSSRTYEILKEFKSEETVRMNKERAIEYKFVHETYGEFFGTVAELMSVYRHENYDISGFYKLLRGKFNWYRGWCYETLKERGNRLSELDTTVKEWYHKDHGTFVGTAKELMEKFDVSEKITDVLYGNRLSRDSWCIKENENNMDNRSNRSQVYKFHHPTKGEFQGSTTDLKAFDRSISMDGINEMIRGKNTNHKGWSLKPNVKTKRNNFYKFVHKEHGERFLMIKDLIKEFPDLKTSPLRRLVKGEDIVYKGWFHETIKEVPNTYVWVNDKLGLEFEGTTSDLYYKYPEHKLDRSGLTKVTKGKVKKSKGWSIKK